MHKKNGSFSGKWTEITKKPVERKGKQLGGGGKSGEKKSPRKATKGKRVSKTKKRKTWRKV